ncbi:MAG: hypothetical protein P8101_05395 [Candidatus Thiodiazotropha sp.]|jgi:hypothetical protein
MNLRSEPAVVMNSGTRLSGECLNAGGSQYSGSWKKHIIFHEGGSFEMSSFSMNSNSMMGGGKTGPGGVVAPFVTVLSSSDKQGTSGSSSVIGANVAGGSWSKHRVGSKNTGRYEINEYSITLYHDNCWKHSVIPRQPGPRNRLQIALRTTKPELSANLRNSIYICPFNNLVPVFSCLFNPFHYTFHSYPFSRGNNKLGNSAGVGRDVVGIIYDYAGCSA